MKSLELDSHSQSEKPALDESPKSVATCDNKRLGRPKLSFTAYQEHCKGKIKNLEEKIRKAGDDKKLIFSLKNKLAAYKARLHKREEDSAMERKVADYKMQVEAMLSAIKTELSSSDAQRVIQAYQKSLQGKTSSKRQRISQQ